MGTPVQIPSPRPATSSTVASAPAPVGQAAAAGGMVAGEKNLRRLKADTNGWEYAARDQTLPKEREEAHDRDRDVADALGSNRFNPNFHTEGYDHIVDNAFIRVADHPLSTFSIDVDTASYANIRRMLTAGSLPPPGAVRIEEMVNYFTYNYGGSGHAGPHPFVTSVAVASAPWAPSHRLVRLGIQAKSIPMNQRSRANLVFLLDVSGSMSSPNKLPLVREAMKMLLTQLRPDDTVAIVVYAGASGLVLDATPVSQRQTIIDAIDQLTPGGSTNGAAGIQLAYNLATQHFVQTPGGINRVILATDGDFNVGVTSQDELVRLIEDKRKSGVFLSVFGFGMGNLKDSTLEKLADKGNGNYGYIDTLAEARKNFIEQAGSTLITVAKDVKIQIEFNPAAVAAYRLIGYENRLLAKEDFNDDTKDAGEIGSGHTVTALYEIIPAGSAEAQETAAAEIKQLQDRIAEIKAFIMRARLTPEALQALNDEIARHEARIAQLQSGTVTLPPAVDELKYQKVQSKFGPASELMTLKLRYKQPDGDVSTKLESPVADAGRTFEQADNDFQFAASVAAMGMMLRNSPHKGALTWDQTLALAQQAVAGRVMPLDGNVIGADRAEQPVYSDHAYRLEFVELIKTARQLAAGQAPQPVRPE
jgi:Ca-activated chloride channel family protein